MSASVPLSVAPREDQLFPTLTQAQIARVARKGRRRAVNPGDVLIEEGQSHFPLVVVTDGELEVVRSSCDGEQLVTTHRQGQFSGELNLLTGRRGLATIRATMTGEVIEVQRDDLLGLVQTDAELSEIFMRAFILRRALLLDRNFGDVIVLGSEFSPRTLQIREFLARNAHPVTYIDLDHDADVQALLDRFHVAADRQRRLVTLNCLERTVECGQAETKMMMCLGGMSIGMDGTAERVRRVLESALLEIE